MDDEISEEEILLRLRKSSFIEQRSNTHDGTVPPPDAAAKALQHSGGLSGAVAVLGNFLDGSPKKWWW